MFGFSKHAAEQASIFLHPGDLELGASTGFHTAYDFDEDIFGAFIRGITAGVRACGYAEVAGSTSAPDFAGAVYRRYSGVEGSTVLARIHATSSGYAGIASCSIEVAYRKGDPSGATAAQVITSSVENELKALKTLGDVRRKSEMSKAMKSEVKASL